MHMFSKKQEYELITAIRSRGEIPLKFVYMGEGAKLWDEISKKESGDGILGMEHGLLMRHINDFFNAFSGVKRLNVVDLGCGNGVPAIPLIRKAKDAGFDVRYVPLDISPELLDMACRNVAAEFPGIRVIPKEIDFEAGNFADVAYEVGQDGYVNFFIFFGNTLGNFSDAGRVLSNFRDSMGSQDYLLIGTELANLSRIDLVVQRYVEHQPICRIHLMLPGKMGIGQADAEYEVSWNDRHQQIESKIRLKRDIDATLGGERIPLKKGERILLMRSKKHTESSLTKLLSDTGFRNEILTTDADRAYIMTLVQPTRFNV